MDKEEADLTPGQEWQQSLNATCNRLSTQYLNLLRAASSVSALEKGGRDPRGKLPKGRLHRFIDPFLSYKSPF